LQHQDIGGLGIAQGSLIVIITSTDEKKKVVELGNNTLCQQFLNAVAAWSIGQNNTGQNPISPPMQFILGKGSGIPQVSDTALFNPQFGTQRLVAARTTNANTSIFTTNYNIGQLNDTYTEAGLLDANNNLMAHIVFQSPIAVTNTESATFIWQITWNAG